VSFCFLIAYFMISGYIIIKNRRFLHSRAKAREWDKFMDSTNQFIHTSKACGLLTLHPAGVL